MNLLTKHIFVLFLMLFSMVVKAEDPGLKFDPQRFQIALEQFIVKEAGLSPQESAHFFPLYREMQNKQRSLFVQMRGLRHVDTRDDKASMEAIRKLDELELQMKKVQQSYHSRFMKVIPAGKVFQVIRAEEKFHRQAFRRAFERR
jgi:hypothetical protein